MRDHAQPVRGLLAHVDADIFHLAVLQQILAAFVDQKLRVPQQIALMGDEPVAAGSIRFFVGDGEKNHVAIERDLLALQHDHHDQLRQAFVFHVLRAAAPDVAVSESLR